MKRFILKTFSNILIVFSIIFIAMIFSSIYDTKRGLWGTSYITLEFDNCEFLCKFSKNKEEVEILASCDGVIFDKCEYSDGHVLKGRAYKRIMCCNESFNRCIILFVPSEKIVI